MRDGSSPDMQQLPGLNEGKALNIPALQDLFNGDLPSPRKAGRQPATVYPHESAVRSRLRQRIIARVNGPPRRNLDL
jgi:hypothetical protein